MAISTEAARGQDLLERPAGEDPQMTDDLLPGAAVDAAEADLGEERLHP